MKNKSKILTLSTILNTVSGIVIVVICIYMLQEKLPRDMNNEYYVLLLFLPVIGVILAYIVTFIGLLMATIEIITAWISYITNNKTWMIVHIVMLVMVSFIGSFFSFYLNLSISTVLYFWFAITIALRINGYQNQKSIKTQVSKSVQRNKR